MQGMVLTLLLCATALLICPGLDGYTEPNEASIYDPEHGVKMGIPFRSCDDGKHGIEVDWSPTSEEETTCIPEERLAIGRTEKNEFVDLQDKPVKHVLHKCLNETINYPTDLPMSGNHRPLWPRFGEYTYLPPQRWVHTLEHGGVVLLYHPCMKSSGNSNLDYLKNLVRHCVRKHVISPYRKIPGDMPYALVAFGHARVFHFYRQFDDQLVKTFIREWGLKGPERSVVKDGQYDVGFLPDSVVGLADLADTRLCRPSGPRAGKRELPGWFQDGIAHPFPWG